MITNMDGGAGFDEALRELVSAEDFLDFFGVPYDERVVRVKRLHILQRFHDYLERRAGDMPADAAGRAAIYRKWLARAYDDFVGSDALAEKVFAVFRKASCSGCGASSFVPPDEALR
ncbi:MAG: nitrogenase-stabilizing/protective protein NifW [Azoarcus sp.]|nr:nitrogenase-stabilizing/protective protein NifW [Azoarcus sp.]